MKQLLLALICLSFFLNACVETQNNDQQELLIGSWIFESGTRNGSTEGTELLKNLVFDFTDKALKCDILPEMVSGFSKEMNYELKENKITVGKRFEMTLKEVTDEKLLLQFELNLGGEPFDFDLTFNRQ